MSMQRWPGLCTSPTARLALQTSCSSQPRERSAVGGVAWLGRWGLSTECRLWQSSLTIVHPVRQCGVVCICWVARLRLLPSYAAGWLVICDDSIGVVVVVDVVVVVVLACCVYVCVRVCACVCVCVCVFVWMGGWVAWDRHARAGGRPQGQL